MLYNLDLVNHAVASHVLDKVITSTFAHDSVWTIKFNGNVGRKSVINTIYLVYQNLTQRL